MTSPALDDAMARARRRRWRRAIALGALVSAALYVACVVLVGTRVARLGGDGTFVLDLGLVVATGEREGAASRFSPGPGLLVLMALPPAVGAWATRPGR